MTDPLAANDSTLRPSTTKTSSMAVHLISCHR
jgi:hypothetical protein